MSSDQVTLLLGAGFSKEICPEFPTMKELTKAVFEDEEVSLQIRALDRQQAIFRTEKLEDVNIEDWLQILEESGAYFKDPRIFDRRKLVVQIALQVITTKIQDISKNLTFSDEQLDLFQMLIESRVNIITTNYDLIFEKAIAELISRNRLSIGTPYDLLIGRIEMAHQRKSGTYLSAGNIDRTQYSNIYKLHGSCDWYTSEIDSSEQIYADISLVTNFLADHNRIASKEVCESMSSVLAGPTSIKSQLINSKAIKPIWISAYSALRNTSRLFIYGSSLHRTDAALNSLLIEGLPTSVGAHIYDKEPEAILNRANEITTRASNTVAPSERVSFRQMVEMVTLFQQASSI
jgi:hypothetical protein